MPARARPGSRLRAGELILAAAAVRDTRGVAESLAGFAAQQRDYADAQDQVAAAERRLWEERQRVAAVEAACDRAIEPLARALILEPGRDRRRPFAGYPVPSPSLFVRLGVGNKVRAVERLAAALRREPKLSALVTEAAAALQREAERLAAAQAPVAALATEVRSLRYRRDAIGDRWDAALTALKWQTRLAESQGATGLYAALFGRVARRRKRRAKPG